jgi:uncharacterized iron-regulated protein
VNHRRAVLVAAALGAAWSLSGCAIPGVRTGAAQPSRLSLDSAEAAMPEAMAQLFGFADPIDFLLLGEVHDHPLQHRLRAAWLETLARRGRFVLAMEQFDASRQPDIDAARARGSGPREIAQASGFEFRGWDWELYEPYVELALRHDLPLVGANLSTSRARAIARGEPDAMAGIEPGGWSDEDRERLAEDIRVGHCGMLPPATIEPMASAQRARDATMARALVDAHRACGLPVVLLAGNGHVRRDLGVPRYLRDLAPRARVFSLGLIERSEGQESREEGAPSPRDEGALSPFDLTIETPAHPRPDPCEAFRKRPRPAGTA